MNEQHFEEWVSAIESGRFPQGRGRMRSSEGLCCLAVGCEVAGIEYDGHAALPSRAFIEWLDIPFHRAADDRGPDAPYTVAVNDDEYLTSAAVLNDGSEFEEPRTFPQIAAWLRENKDRLVATA